MSFIDIILQSGEFEVVESSFWADLFINIVGALIGTGTALYVFNLGIQKQRENEKHVEEATRDKRLSNLSSRIESIISTSEEQEKYINAFIETIKGDIVNIPRISVLSTRPMNKYLELETHDEYYHAYLDVFGFTAKNVKGFNALYNSIDYMYSSTQEKLNSLQKSIEFDFERKKEYQKIVDKVMDESAILIMAAKENGTEDKFTIFLKSILDAFYASEVDFSDLKYFQTMFVEPVRTGILKEFKSNLVAVNIAQQLKEASSKYANIKFSNEAVLRDFDSWHKKYNNASQRLIETSLQLREKYGNKEE